MTGPSPPSGAVRLLRWAIGMSDVAEGILGDLTEEFRARGEEHGAGAAARWFWLQALWIAAVFRIRGRGARPGGPARATVVDRLLEELAHASRSLRRTPKFTALSVAVLGLGIGAATAVFAGFQSVALTDLPVSDAPRIVSLSLHDSSGNGVALLPDEIDAVRERSRTLRSVAGTLDGTGRMPVTADDDRPLVLDFTFVTAEFFEVLGARAALGRLFRPEDGAEGAPPVTVISHRTWQREFSGARDVLGQRLTATQYQRSYEIVGVAPPGLDVPVGVDYWILPGPRRQALSLVARLEAGITPDAARSEFLALATAIEAERANPSEPTAASLRGLTEASMREARPILVAMTSAAALLLLIACANVAGLLLIRAARRTRDMTVRRALGASSGRIARAALLEATLLGAAGGTLGLLVSMGLLQVLRSVVPGHVPRSDMIGTSGAPIALAATVTACAVALVAVGPSLTAAKHSASNILNGSGRWATSTRRTRAIRRSLVAAQVALTVVVLFGAGLLTRTLRHLSAVPLGYEIEGVSVLELGIDRRNLDGGPPELADLLGGVFDELRALPGVTSVTPLMARPFTGSGAVYETAPLLEGQTETEAAANPRVPLESGGPEIFRTLGIPIVRGRAFLESDREDAPNVAVVSASLAERLWPGRSPIGERIRLSLGREEWWTVVGVAGETRFRRLREPTPTIYLPWRQFQILPMAWTVAVRADGDSSTLAPAMRDAVRGYDPRVYLWTVRSLREHLAQGPISTPRTMALLLAAFGLTALLLAAIGLYGVMALAVHEQTRELGIKRALGAPEHVLRRSVLGDALRMTGLGGVLGLGIALFAARLLAPLLFQVRPADPVTMAAVSAVILGVCVSASYLPVRQATRIDPRMALQGD